MSITTAGNGENIPQTAMGKVDVFIMIIIIIDMIIKHDYIMIIMIIIFLIDIIIKHDNPKVRRKTGDWRSCNSFWGFRARPPRSHNSQHVWHPSSSSNLLEIIRN